MIRVRRGIESSAKERGARPEMAGESPVGKTVEVHRSHAWEKCQEKCSLAVREGGADH